MDTIRFEIEAKGLGIYDNSTKIIINGADLIDLLREYELPFAAKEGHESIAGGYSGIGSTVLFSRLFDGGDIITILVCRGCGEDGCWPMQIAIVDHGSTIEWKNFHQPHRSRTSKSSFWDYSQFPSFIFEKEAYEEALKLLD